jgi:hypothetical protein
MRSGSGLRRIPDPHLHTGGDDGSCSAAYVLAIDALIQINDVTKRQDRSGQPTVDRVTLEIAPDEAMAVMSPSGGGRSALASLIADLDRPTKGTITAAGQRIDRLTGTAMPRSRARARARAGATGARCFGSLGYAVGHAFASDDLRTMADAYLTVEGERSRYFGPNRSGGRVPGFFTRRGGRGSGRGPADRWLRLGLVATPIAIR